MSTTSQRAAAQLQTDTEKEVAAEHTKHHLLTEERDFDHAAPVATAAAPNPTLAAPVAGNDAPSEDRAAIYGKRSQQVQEEININEDELSPEQVFERRRLDAWAGKEDNTGASQSLTGPSKGEDGYEEAALDSSQRRAAPAPDTSNESATLQQGLDTNPDATTIKVYGQLIEVSRSEIDEAGGIEALQKSKAASEQLRRASTALATLRSETQELDNAKKMFAAGLNPDGSPISQHQSAESQTPPSGDTGGTELDINDLAANMVEGLWTSDSQEEATKKVAESLSKIMSERPKGSTPVSEETVRNTAREDFSRTMAASGATSDTVETDRLAANEMFFTEFQELQSNVNRQGFDLARQEITNVANSPLMTGRPQVEIVRMAGDRTRQLLQGEIPEPLDFSYDPANAPVTTVSGDERTHITGRMEHKQRTTMHQPAASRTSQRHELVEPGSTVNNSAYVEELRKRRNQH